MAEYPYLNNTGKIVEFFKHMQEARVPTAKVSQKYLESVGFKSKDDRRLVSVAKFLGFLDGNGMPTDIWSQYRDKKTAKTVISRAIEKSYSELFQRYPRVTQIDDEDLRNFFSTATGLGRVSVNAATRTFKAVCGLAEFGSEANETVTSSDSSKPAVSEPVANVIPEPQRSIPININIQLHLPATEDPKIYENLFAALRKHLL